MTVPGHDRVQVEDWCTLGGLPGPCTTTWVYCPVHHLGTPLPLPYPACHHTALCYRDTALCYPAWTTFVNVLDHLWTTFVNVLDPFWTRSWATLPPGPRLREEKYWSREEEYWSREEESWVILTLLPRRRAAGRLDSWQKLQKCVKVSKSGDSALFCHFARVTLAWVGLFVTFAQLFTRERRNSC